MVEQGYIEEFWHIPVAIGELKVGDQFKWNALPDHIFVVTGSFGEGNYIKYYAIGGHVEFAKLKNEMVFIKGTVRDWGKLE